MELFPLHKVLGLGVLLCCSTIIKAQFSVDKKTISIGDVELYSDIDASFRLKNKTNTNVSIKKIITSNSLVKATCSNMTLAANGQTTITVKGQTSTAGRFTYAVYVYTDHSDKPYELFVKGRSVLDLASRDKNSSKTPSSAFGVKFDNLSFSTDNIEFDYVNDGDVISETIYVTNEGDTECEPNLMMLPKYLSVKAVPKKLKPGRSGYLVVTLDSRMLDHRMGLTQNMVYASSFRGEKVSKSNAIPVSVVLFDTTSVVSSANAPSIQLSTNQLILPAIKKKKTKGELTISNTGKSNLKIRSIQTFHPAVNVELPKTDLSPGETITLKVAVVKKYLDVSSASHRILMITNDYKKPVVLITVKNESK